jgi:hypothetical protein
VLRKTLASCTKAHAPEDDDTGREPLPSSLPSMMLFAQRRQPRPTTPVRQPDPRTR